MNKQTKQLEDMRKAIKDMQETVSRLPEETR